MSEENSYGSIIHAAKRRIGWTQQELANKFDTEVSRVTVGRWEHGIQRPSAYHLEQLITIFGLNVKEADELRRAAGYSPPLAEEELPAIDNLPFPQNPFFTGRGEHMERLSALLQETSSVAITQAISISGLGGIGKTELALEYAHRSYPNVYRAALWVNAAEDVLQRSFASLAETLELEEQFEPGQDQRIEAVRRWLKLHTDWLLIMDNADDLSHARSLLPSKHSGHVIFTTRSQITGTTAKRGRHIEVSELEPAEGLRFLLLRSHMVEDETKLDTIATELREAALQLVELLGGHPLALDQAGAYIEGTGVSFTDYINLYQTQRRALLNRRLASEIIEHPEYIQHPESVTATFELCIDMARKRNPLATDILRFCAFLQPDTIPTELFQHDKSFKFDALAFNDGIEALQRYSLIKRNSHKKIFVIHRLVQAVLVDTMSPDLQKQWRDRAVRTIHAAFQPRIFIPYIPGIDFSDDSAEYHEDESCERLLPHVFGCAVWPDDEVTPTFEYIDLLFNAAKYLQEVGELSESDLLLELAVMLFAQHIAGWNPEVIRAIAFNLESETTTLYFSYGQHELAESRYTSAIDLCESTLGTTHPFTQKIRKSYARFLYTLRHSTEVAPPEEDDEDEEDDE